MTADYSHRKPHHHVLTRWELARARRQRLADQRVHGEVRAIATRAGLLPAIPTLADLVRAIP